MENFEVIRLHPHRDFYGFHLSENLIKEIIEVVKEFKMRLISSLQEIKDIPNIQPLEIKSIFRSINT